MSAPFFDTNIMLTQPYPDFNLYDQEMPLYTNARMLPPAKVTNSRIEHAIIGEGSVIVESEITDTVIGIRTFIDAGTRLHRTVLLGSDYYSWQDPAARVLMCSAMGQQALVVEAIQAGAKDFVVKPFQPSRVIEAVQRVLG